MRRESENGSACSAPPVTNKSSPRGSIFGESFDFGASFAFLGSGGGGHDSFDRSLYSDGQASSRRQSSEPMALSKLSEEGDEQVLENKGDDHHHHHDEDIYELEIRDSTKQNTEIVQRNHRLVWKVVWLTVALVGLMAVTSWAALALDYVRTTSSSSNADDTTNGEWQAVNQTTTTTTTRGDALLASYVSSMDQLNRHQQDTMHATLLSLTQSITQYVQATTPQDQQQSAAWPFVTFPSFELLGYHILQINKQVELLAFSPIVAPGMVLAWDAYSIGHQQWLQQSWNLHTILNPQSSSSLPDWFDNYSVIAPHIYQPRTGTNLQGRGPFAPIWQLSPPPRDPALINLDVLSLAGMKRLYQALLAMRQPVVSPVQVLDSTTTLTPASLAETSPSSQAYQLPNPPRSVLMMPIFADLASYQYDHNTTTTNDIVGFIQVMINWESLIANLLPEEYVGYLVLKNNCGQAFTFRIQSRPSGTGSRHEKNVIAYVEERDISAEEQWLDDLHVLNDVLGVGQQPETTTMGDQPVGSCVYSLSVIPDQSFQETHDSTEQVLVQQHLRGQPPTVTKAVDVNDNSGDSNDDMDPLILLVEALIVALPFLLVVIALCYLCKALRRYHASVEERNERLVLTAAKANGIIDHLFPTHFRDRFLGSMTPEESSPLYKNSYHNKRDTRTESERQIDAMIILEVTEEGDDEDEEDTFSENDTNHSRGSNGAGRVPTTSPPPTGFGGGRPVLVPSLPSHRLMHILNNGMSEKDDAETAPIADLFLECTVLFADIAGFTAWSSVREPGQVFTLLETLYKAFDEIAKKRKVFKVETIGDCYVAVTGLPEPQKDHAMIMVRFARDCMYKSYEMTKKLEVTLGPDTGDLTMRFGLHSGPVTAGILRGERSRFQLYGDTVITGKRMESTGQKGRIQLSEDTAQILIEAGKSRLLRRREDTITAKGKGEMVTYWLALGADNDAEGSDDNMFPSSSSFGDMTVGTGDTADTQSVGSVSTKGSRGRDFVRSAPAVSMSGLAKMRNGCGAMDKKERLIDWAVDVLSKLLKQVLARRGEANGSVEIQWHRPDGQTVLDEVVEIITLPQFDEEGARHQVDPKNVELRTVVMRQLREYVKSISDMHRANSFHNWEHASHVTMSVGKLLSRIVAPKSSDENSPDTLHDHTYGITSDPLTQFAVVLAALIHDVDHTGVPNVTLVKENDKIADHYKGKSVAEQNSVDLSWDLLMSPRFKELRMTIYTTSAELTRFRSLLVNTVMATDIVDKELKLLRNARWEKAFSGMAPTTPQEATDDVNRKATIVLEHLIQASDVSHTMQHWHVYRKWNERLFQEMYTAYRAGRADRDPSEFWYMGEIGFFDFYIIPLTKKLKDCGVFGVSSDEYLNWALKNRAEWEKRGAAATAEMVANAREREYAKLEKIAVARAPLIAEIKHAVKTMRQARQNKANNSTNTYRRASFRHLQVDYADDTDDGEDIINNTNHTARGGLTRGGLVAGPGPSSSLNSKQDRAMLKKARMNRTKSWENAAMPVRPWTLQLLLLLAVLNGSCHGFSSSLSQQRRRSFLCSSWLSSSSPTVRRKGVCMKRIWSMSTRLNAGANSSGNGSTNKDEETAGKARSTVPSDRNNVTTSTAQPQLEGIGGKGGVVYNVNRLKRNLLQETMTAYKEDLWALLNHHHWQQPQQQQVLVDKLAALVQASPVRTTTDSNLLEGSQKQPWVLVYRSQYPTTVASLVLYEGDVANNSRNNKRNNNKVSNKQDQAYNARYNFLWQPKQREKAQFAGDSNSNKAKKKGRKRQNAAGRILLLGTTHQRSFHLEDLKDDQDAHVIDRFQILGGLIQHIRHYLVKGLTRSSLTLQPTSDKWSFLGGGTRTAALSEASPATGQSECMQVQVIYLDNDLCITAEADGPESPFWVYTRNQAYLDGTAKRQWQFFQSQCRRVLALPVTLVKNRFRLGGGRRQRQRLQRGSAASDPILREFMASTTDDARLRVLRLGDVRDDDESWESEGDPFVHLSADERQRLLKSMSVKTVEEAGNTYRATQFQKKWLRPWRLFSQKRRNQKQRGFRKPKQPPSE